MKDNMRIWEALGKTDPAHTKTFKRAGGFSGTAVKPMWANKQMTEFFGPCGVGWGQEMPIYQTIEAAGEVLVYCTVGMWYVLNGQRVGPVYGVGGDKVVSQIFLKDDRGNKLFDTEAGRYKTYPQTDDEAFKKAYTDALSNAMKFIGVAADVHMGLFDDNKYVQQVRGEFEADRQAEIAEEVDRQKQNPSKEAFIPNTLTNQLKGSLEMVKTPEERAALERNKLEEQRGTFTLDGDILTCKVRGIQKKESTGAAKKPYLSVTFNGRLQNGKISLEGSNFASCFDTELFEAIDHTLDKECKFKMKLDGKYPNIIDVLWIDGVGHMERPIGNDDLPPEMFK